MCRCAGVPCTPASARYAMGAAIATLLGRSVVTTREKLLPESELRALITDEYQQAFVTFLAHNDAGTRGCWRESPA